MGAVLGASTTEEPASSLGSREFHLKVNPIVMDFDSAKWKNQDSETTGRLIHKTIPGCELEEVPGSEFPPNQTSTADIPPKYIHFWTWENDRGTVYVAAVGFEDWENLKPALFLKKSETQSDQCKKDGWDVLGTLRHVP